MLIRILDLPCEKNGKNTKKLINLLYYLRAFNKSVISIFGNIIFVDFYVIQFLYDLGKFGKPGSRPGRPK